MLRGMRNRRDQGCGHGRLVGAVAGLIDPVQPAARQRLLHVPRRLRAANPIQPAVQQSHWQLAQDSAACQRALGWEKTLGRQVMALQAVLGQQGGVRSGAR